MPIQFTLHPARCYIAGHRLHHGLTGLVLNLIGLALIADDRHDWHVWIADLLASPTPHARSHPCPTPTPRLR